MDYLDEFCLIMRVLIRGRHSARVLERDVMTAANVGVIDGGPQTWGCRQPLPAGKRKQNGFFLKASKKEYGLVLIDTMISAQW